MLGEILAAIDLGEVLPDARVFIEELVLVTLADARSSIDAFVERRGCPICGDILISWSFVWGSLERRLYVLEGVSLGRAILDMLGKDLLLRLGVTLTWDDLTMSRPCEKSALEALQEHIFGRRFSDFTNPTKW